MGNCIPAKGAELSSENELKVTHENPMFDSFPPVAGDAAGPRVSQPDVPWYPTTAAGPEPEPKREEISFPGNIVAGEFGHHGTMCTCSFPGTAKAEWDALVAKADQGGLSTACVFLTAAEQGKHSADPEAGEGSCFCHKLYGKPMECGPGLVKLIGGSSKAHLSLPDSPPPSTAPYIIVYDCTPTWLY